ncbi:MAG: thiolase family protein [Opitutales bacterium]|nr:thiolase family protein [Opitutales bacterium]
MSEKTLQIVDGVRLPFAKAGGKLSHLSAGDLGTAATKALLAKTGIDPEVIDEVIFGCVCQPAGESNVARVIALRSGIPERVPARTVHRNCASGFEAITEAAEKVAAGRGEVFLVGGVESMSRAPLLFDNGAARKFGRLAKARSTRAKLGALMKFRPSDFRPRPALLKGLTDPTCGIGMGETAEILAREFSISRERQDAFALHSHRKAVIARSRLNEEIVPAYGHRFRPMLLDDGPREDTSSHALGRLRPIFVRKRGTVTAGNASQVTDGAVALLVASEAACKAHGFEPLGRLVAHAYAGCDPRRMGLGPIHAMAKARHMGAPRLEEAEVVELNEAFAAQALAVTDACASKRFCNEELKLNEALGEIPDEILNVNGGAIALGHPVGATGARLVLTSLLELKRRKGKLALATLCVGGGQGGALWLERN